MSASTTHDEDFELSIGPGVDLEDGAYPGELIDLELFALDVDGETRELVRWKFLPDGSDTPVEGVSSRSSSPKSKLAAWLAVLVGPEAVSGAKFTRADLLGRRALIIVEHNAHGYPKVAGLAPLPKARPSA